MVMSRQIMSFKSEIDLATPKRGMPVTIITGFLGSGKTTLLNYILTQQKDLKIAVLVNEFGDIDIDTQLLVEIDENMVQLSNGCICCTINDGLVEAVYSILERPDPVDYLVIETTGIADPLPIILTFLGSELRDLTRVDSIVTLVDVETFTPEHFDSDAAMNQILYGDVVLLNKIDLVPVEQIDRLEAYIRDVKTGARLIRCQEGKVPLPLILDVGYTNPSDYQALLNSPQAGGPPQHSHPVPSSAQGESPQNLEHGPEHHPEHEPQHSHGHTHEHEHEHDHKHEHHHHQSEHLANDGFISVSFTSDRPFCLEKFQAFLDQLPTDVFRGKGILWFTESQMKHIFQLSGKRCSLDVENWQAPCKNQLVLIGRNLNMAQLHDNLEACCVQD
jgi:G3E family GTPase